MTLRSIHTGHGVALLAALSLTLVSVGPAAAATGSEGDEAKAAEAAQADPQVAKADPNDSGAPAAGPKVTATGDKAEDDDKFPLSASLQIATSIGFGTFVSGDQAQPLNYTAFVPKVAWAIDDAMSLSASISASVYSKMDFPTPYENGKFLLGDLYLNFSHAKLFHTDDVGDGLTIAGGFRVFFPTSLAAQFQNRALTLRPAVATSLKLGPVTIGWTLALAKFFSSTSVPSLTCSGFAEGACIDGRPTGPGPGGGFTSERRGGEVFLPSAGVTSFYVLNSLSVGWEIIEGLSLSGSAAIYNQFGTRSYDVDSLSSVNARAGRSQLDRVVSSISLDYQVIKQLSVGIGVATDAIQPFGASGDRFIFLDPTHASDNTTTLDISVTGSI